ncbi:outer membrane beta-barrel protein [Pedobacter heparinus]|uniref:outer membrane beta-barrel protein n=1 Tax=Pedobacter heparinus TaxID=984 RepID=UPI00292DD8A0|nr:outer membrane beta-barrel protein [Pedobacter heparinus]
MELNDKEFDATFRKKVFDAEPQFEEAAWDKMEQKLRRRDRVVFFRKAGALCLLLLLCCLAGYLMFDQQLPGKLQPAAAGKSKPLQLPDVRNRGGETNPVPETDQPAAAIKYQELYVDLADSSRSPKTEERLLSAESDSLNRMLAGKISTPSVPEPEPKIDSVSTGLPGTDVLPAAVATIGKKQKTTGRRIWPLSLSLSAGPEFNSSGAMLGGKTGFSAGFGFGIHMTKRITLQTGLTYSRKDYAADNYEYKFKSVRAMDVISRVDASCAVLEIPLQLAYTVLDDAQKSIDLNVGMSSYFMLKEDYIYRYNAGSGIADRLQEYRNQNQHYLGVADLSATYYIKLKKEGLRLGLEPYVKIPLTGVGEGKVNLKSSGISLKLRYDLGKKNN